MALPLVKAGIMNIGKALKGIGDGFRTGAGAASSAGNETINRTAYKIRRNSLLIKNERSKQAKFDKEVSDEVERRGREDQIESKSASKKVPNTLKAIFIDKPLSIFTYLAQAWVIKNGPVLIKRLTTFTKKVRVFMAVIKRLPGVVLKTIGATIKFATTFMSNVLNFDFEDKRKKMEGAQKEFDSYMGDTVVTFGELKNVWNRSDEELDTILKNLENDATISQALRDGGVEEFDFVVPTTPMVGPQPEPSAGGGGGGGSTRGGKVGALLDTISYAEGTPSYGTIYGGAIVPELEAGVLSIQEVLTMQKTGKVRGRDAGYRRDSYDSDATGRYQFMSYVLKEEAEKQGIPLSTKFTPALQDKLILGRLERVRGVSEADIERDGLSSQIIDQLAPEFASFPNLIGPDAKGRTGTNSSYYGQGGKSEDDLKQNFAGNVQANQQPAPGASPGGGEASPLAAAPPQGNAAPGALAAAGEELKKSRLDTSRYGRNGCVYAVNQVYKRAGLTPPWGSSIYVPTARAKLISAGYSRVSVSDARPGDIVIMRDTHPTEPWIHIGVVGPRGTVLHNSSSNQAFTNDESFASLSSRYVGIEIFRMPTKTSTRATNPLISSSPNLNTSSKLDSAATIASNQTGGTRNRTRVISTTQKEYILVS